VAHPINEIGLTGEIKGTGIVARHQVIKIGEDGNKKDEKYFHKKL
jgi:hypothetical protein